MCSAICALWNSNLPPAEYDRAAQFLKESYGADGVLPPEFSEWRLSAERFRFNTSFGWGAVLEAVTLLSAQGAQSTQELAAVTPADISRVCTGAPNAHMVRASCGAQRSCLASRESSGHLAKPHGFLAKDAFTGAIKRHKALFGRHGRLRVRISHKIPGRQRLTRMGHAQKIKALGENRILPPARSIVASPRICRRTC